ncbi:EAL domain-containing protein [Brevibacillus agri]|uniref:EAL domain-containing protein n=1 Tax=Brevibacillus agri TaxID=51101 RepID=UPI0030F42F26
MPNSFETRWLHPDGRSIELSVMKVPVDIAGELMGTHIIIKDITEEIDRSFITDISQSQNDRAIVSTIIAMAQNLKLDVIAEGIETKNQLDILTKMTAKKSRATTSPAPCQRTMWRNVFHAFAPSGQPQVAGLAGGFFSAAKTSTRAFAVRFGPTCDFGLASIFTGRRLWAEKWEDFYYRRLTNQKFCY